MKEKTMRNQILKFRKEDGVAVIELAALIDTQDQMRRLSENISECCQEFRMNDSNSVLVITEGTPGLFAIESRNGLILMDLPGCASISQSIGECEKPVIIGILGDAVDLGLEMALACDVRVASETSRFGFSQIKMGLMPWDGGTQRLSRTVGKGKALEMILTGELIDAPEASRVGLVNRIVPAEKVTTTAMDLAKDMASKSAISLQYCKEAILKGMDLTLEQGLRLEADLYFLMHTTHDREEGIKAFQEKRKPRFKGR
jgi:enoyl-CoA hydratase/carnithine racemase